MIYYYSACGNSKWVANEMAKATGDSSVSIVDINRDAAFNPQIDCERLGIVFPVYAWNTPDIVMDFVKKLNVSDKTYVYIVCTCGNETGYLLNRLKKVLRVDAAFSVQMPNTYIIMFDTDGEAMEKKLISSANERVQNIAADVNAKAKVTDMHVGTTPFLKTYIEFPFFKMMICDKKFTADGNCISCGLCERVCPVKNITLENGKPVWHGNCTHCTACINRCPEKAIQYGNATKKRGRYYFKEDKD